MKKTLVIGLAVALVFIIAAGAMAFGPGYHKGPCYGAGSNLTPEQSQKLAEFQKEILPLRQKMLQLKTDLMTLRAQPTTDWKAIADKQKEMVDVKVEIQKKATGAGFAGSCHGLYGHGMGKTEMCRMATMGQ